MGGTLAFEIKFIVALFFGPTINGSITALIRDPYHPHKDENGMVELTETELVRQLNLMDNTRVDRESAYRTALKAVQDAKFLANLKRDTPLITSKTTFGKPKTLNPHAQPKLE